MKGFKKDGKFRPTGNKKQGLKKSDIQHQHADDRIGRTLPLSRKKQSMNETDSGEIPPKRVYDKDILTKYDGKFYLVSETNLPTISVDEYEKDPKDPDDFIFKRNIIFGQGEDADITINDAGAMDDGMIDEEKLLSYLDGAGALEDNSRSKFSLGKSDAQKVADKQEENQKREKELKIQTAKGIEGRIESNNRSIEFLDKRIEDLQKNPAKLGAKAETHLSLIEEARNNKESLEDDNAKLRQGLANSQI